MFGFGRHTVNARLINWSARLSMIALEVQKHPDSVHLAWTARETLQQYTEFLEYVRDYMLRRGQFEEFADLRPLLAQVSLACQNLELEMERLDPDRTQAVSMNNWEHTQVIGRIR